MKRDKVRWGSLINTSFHKLSLVFIKKSVVVNNNELGGVTVIVVIHVEASSAFFQTLSAPCTTYSIDSIVKCHVRVGRVLVTVELPLSGVDWWLAVMGFSKSHSRFRKDMLLSSTRCSLCRPSKRVAQHQLTGIHCGNFLLPHLFVQENPFTVNSFIILLLWLMLVSRRISAGDPSNLPLFIFLQLKPIPCQRDSEENNGDVKD